MLKPGVTFFNQEKLFGCDQLIDVRLVFADVESYTIALDTCWKLFGVATQKSLSPGSYHNDKYLHAKCNMQAKELMHILFFKKADYEIFLEKETEVIPFVVVSPLSSGAERIKFLKPVNCLDGDQAVCTMNAKGETVSVRIKRANLIPNNKKENN